MTDLMICDVPAGESDSGTRFAGLPLAPVGAKWPRCESCEGAMQFLGQIALPVPAGETARLLLLFMCANDPGMCEEWDPDAGGNRAFAVDAADLVAMKPPKKGQTTREGRFGVRIESLAGQDYDAARDEWCRMNGARGREIVGQMFGTPAWVQGEQIPGCDDCGQPMRFVAQLEEGPDHETAINFGGGGCGYVFDCRCGAQSAKLLWQC
jgi:hypothetical protein